MYYIQGLLGINTTFFTAIDIKHLRQDVIFCKIIYLHLLGNNMCVECRQ